ncbi:hypothetical protein M378DRAFT_89191 [Amanita muscaria Koide BX008]|uniref:EngB-type G domain-containing protein n=1 Tax=Amanita muscaria (strain Koide BX008) TaxID=946122 RepID=A0A0C2W5Z0_AMAMK|nr:hypothetical protein M378DRAFT_89191 [Amanita muscaria Koide BX008]
MLFRKPKAASLRTCLIHKVPARQYAENKNAFYTTHAEFVASASSLERIPHLQGLPEVVVTGRANCGKSSLFNAVLGRRSLLNTSQKAGRTRTLNFYHVGTEPPKLVLVDAPGYGARGRPEWGKLFDGYLETRKELKRVFILFNAKHPLNTFDTMMLTHLSEILVSQRERFTLQAVITKVDDISLDEVGGAVKRIREGIREVTHLCLPPIVTSAKMQPPFGIEEVRKNIGQACGLKL